MLVAISSGRLANNDYNPQHEVIPKHGSEQLGKHNELDSAYWKWVNAMCPHPERSQGRAKWIAQNQTFAHDGVEYKRYTRRQRSNSGKSSRWFVSFTGNDGSHYADPVGPNRRNDAERNWGLGRE